MTGNKLLITTRIISKVMGMILVIAGGIELFIGFIFALFMGPIELPQADNIMLIGIAALALLFKSIPYLLMIIGAIGLCIGVVNHIISAVLDNYVDLEMIDKKRKTYKLIISACFYAILVIPNFILTIMAIVDAEDFFTTTYIIGWLFIISLPNIIMFTFLLVSRNIIKKYQIEEVSIIN